MQVYFSPELIKEDAQVLNIIDQNGNAVGYLAFIIDEKKYMYAVLLENEGMQEDFRDLVTPYIEGMSKTKEEPDVFCYLSVGGERLDIEQDQSGGQ